VTKIRSDPIPGERSRNPRSSIYFDLRVGQRNWWDHRFYLDVGGVGQVGDGEGHLGISGSGFRVPERPDVRVESSLVRRTVPGESQFFDEAVVERGEDEEEAVAGHPQSAVAAQDLFYEEKDHSGRFWCGFVPS
jgi:hypothetical protein